VKEDDLVKKAYDLGIVRWDVAKELVELITKTEREACAKVCEDFDFEFQDDSAGTLQGVAEAIRARGNQ